LICRYASFREHIRETSALVRKQKRVIDTSAQPAWSLKL
jgi:hypothetical protein